MVDLEVREVLKDYVCDGAVMFDNPAYDKSIIGTTTDGYLVYDYGKMVCELASDDDISLEEAEEFIQYNTIRSLDYLGTSCKPVIINLF